MGGPRRVRRSIVQALSAVHSFARGWRQADEARDELARRGVLPVDVEVDELDARDLAELPDWLIAALLCEVVPGSTHVELERRPVEYTPDVSQVPRLAGRPRARVIFRFPVALLRLEGKRRGLA